MAELVQAGATLKCSFGMAPSTLAVLPAGHVTVDAPVANVSDFVPLTNVMPFGTCSSMSNPAVASATAAAQGVLTPQPCVPQTVAPWILGGSPKVTGMKLPVVQSTDSLLCLWGGEIRVVSPGQTKVVVK